MATRTIEQTQFPWYRTRPRTAIALAVALFAAVSVARFLTDGAGEAVDILYALPIALLAMAFGVRGGMIGATVGFALFALFELVDGTGDIDATGWLARAAGMALLGLLLGRSVDQVEAGQRLVLESREHRRRLQETARRQAEALEISDSVLQHLAAVKWLVESERNTEAIELLNTTIETGQRIVSEQLPLEQHVLDADVIRDISNETI